MNGNPRGARAESSAGKDLPPPDQGPNGMRSAQAHDSPDAGQRDPKRGLEVLRCDQTELRS